MRAWWGRVNMKERDLLREHVGRNWHEMNACDVVRKLLTVIKREKEEAQHPTRGSDE